MYFGTDTKETVSVMGTPAFMEFVESIRTEGVSFERVPMGGGAVRQDSLIVEVDRENQAKNLMSSTFRFPSSPAGSTASSRISTTSTLQP